MTRGRRWSWTSKYVTSVDLAAGRADMVGLRRLVEAGSRDAVDELVQLAAEHGAVQELGRLASMGFTDAADVLAEIHED